jgi:signal transduction histidine kinase
VKAGARPPGSAALLGAAVLLAALLVALGGAGLLELGWGWALSLVCACAGLALIAAAPSAEAMYAGVLARFSADPRARWGLRAVTVLSAPIAALGPTLYALLALAQALAEPHAREPVPDWRRALGTGFLGLAFVLCASELGAVVGDDALLWPVLGGTAALSAFWWLRGPSRAVRRAFGAIAVVVLLFYGAFSFGRPDSLFLASVAGAVALTLIVAPRWLRKSRALAAERARRARSEERAEVAGMVHDSVLQTLALIQSRADDPAEVRALARTQSRDLRARLFGHQDPDEQPASIAAALRAVAAEVEAAHKVKIDVVTVGDAPLDERSSALVAAAREALFNAVRHAPDAPVSLFGEVDDRRVSAYVRDRGPGFDLETIPSDRRGVTDSIVARMVRHGGHAAVRTAPGGGCEVQLVLDRTP